MATQSLSPEMTSYARLCLAINDVCTKSFRDVLLCSVPNKDIKQAIKAHWGPHYNSPMLKKYPYSNFFPNHQLDPNFSVSNCDMSLLYSLIRNVSSVQQPSLGWGQSCWNNPQDTSIGANVERLHELRNTVIHLQEPRLSNQEFNSYWNKLRGCVTVIDTYLGGTTYQEKLECLRIDDMDPECANRLIGTFRSSLQDLQAGQLEQDKTLYNIGEKLNQGFQDNKIADDRMIEELSEVKDLIKEDNRQLSQTVEHVKELKDRFEVIHKLMEGKAKENDKIQPQLNSDHGVRTENTTSNQDEHESEITLEKHDSRDSENTKDWNENRVEKTDVDKSSRSESLAVQVQLKTKDVLVKADHDNNGGIEIGDLASGLDGKLCITKQYAFIKSNLTRESGLVIAKCLLKQKLLSQDAYDRMGNTCCARRHPIDILLKKVIHGGKEEIVEAFFKRLKVECPLIARAVKDTTITEMDRLRFAQLEARGVEAGGLFRIMWCVTSGPDVRFFKYHLSESEEVVEHITDVMLSRLHFSIQDHSSIIDCPTSDNRISVLFQKMQLYKLDVVKELSDVVKHELHQKWMKFRSTQDPWWSGLFQWMKQSKPVIDGSFEFENIELKEVETGSIILKFIAGVNFSVDLLKPESLKNKIKTLLKRGCLESKTETKSVAHITVYIESPPNKDRKEIHIYIDFHATDVSIEAEDHQDEMRIRNRDIMLEEMNPARLKQWMLDQPCIQKSHRDMLESKLSEKGLFRQEEMTVLLDFISGLENGYHLLEKYCEKNDLYVYNKVFRKHQESHSQQEISGHRAAVTYVKGGGLQKLFSFSIILNDEGIDPDTEEGLLLKRKGIKKSPFSDKDQPPEESFRKEQGMSAEATVNYIGFHTVKGDNVQIKEDIVTWNPVANGAAAFSEQPLSAGVPVEVEITGSGHVGLGIISIDPEKLKCKPLYRLKDIPQYFQISRAQLHKRKCRLTASLLTCENKVVITYDVKKYTQTIESGMKVWLAIYVHFGDVTLKLDSCKASCSCNPIFSAIKGPNLQFGDGMNEVRTISSKPGAMCFIKNPLKVNQRMTFACEPLPDGQSLRGTAKRFHLTVYITEADPLELYRQHKDIFTISAAQTSEPGWVCSVIIKKDNCHGQINIEREPDTIILTDALNKEVMKQIHIDQRTKLWVALELFRVSVRQVEVATLTPTEDPGAAHGYITVVNQPQRHLNVERHVSIPYLDVEGNANTPDIELFNDQSQPETTRDEKIQFISSYNGHFSKLVNDLTPVSLCDELLSLEIITGQQYEEIRQSRSVFKQNRILLQHLWKRPVSKLQFISCLKKSGNEHLVQYFFFPN